MTKAGEGFYIIANDGTKQFVFYDDLDSDILPQLWRPVPGTGFVYSADKFLRLEIDQVPFIVDGWIPKQGKSLIYAPAKTGKSFLSCQLARCIASGENFLGIHTEASSVLYLQYEMGVEVLQSRMKATGQEYPTNMFVGTTYSMKLDEKEGQETLENILALVGPEVVILDPFYKVLSGDENDTQDVKVITDFLDEMIALFKTSFVIIHHSGKDASKGGRGTSLLEGWVDSYIRVMPKNTGDNSLAIEIQPQRMRHCPPGEKMVAVMHEGEFQLEGVLTTKDELLQFIAVNQSFTVSDLVKSSGISTTNRTTIYKHLGALEAAGLIEKTKRGGYMSLVV